MTDRHFLLPASAILPALACAGQRLPFALIGVCALAVSVHVAQAQTCTTSGSTVSCPLGTAAIKVNGVATLGITASPSPLSATATAATFGSATPLNVGKVTVTVQSNLPWAVTVSAPTTFTSSAKKSADVLLGLNGYGSSALPFQIKTGSATNSLPFDAYFRVKLNWASDAPGTYTIPVTFTLAAP